MKNSEKTESDGFFLNMKTAFEQSDGSYLWPYGFCGKQLRLAKDEIEKQNEIIKNLKNHIIDLQKNN